VVPVLLINLERLSQTGRTHFKLIVIALAIESALDVSAQVGAVLNPHTLGVVNLNCYLAILADDNVYQKILFVG
jgi:hypothetical protein